MALHLLDMRRIEIYNERQQNKCAILIILAVFTKQNFTAHILREGAAHLMSCL